MNTFADPAASADIRTGHVTEAIQPARSSIKAARVLIPFP